MLKRKAVSDDAISCPLLIVPLLRRLLTAEAALVQPAMLCCVSKSVRRAVASVLDDVGFWHDLTVRCMPRMRRMPFDVAYFLRTGRFGAPESSAAQNTAWRLNYMRIVKTYLGMRIFCRVPGSAVTSVPIMPYCPGLCVAADAMFCETAQCAAVQLASSRSTTGPAVFQYDVNCGGAEPSAYRFTLMPGQERKINFGSRTLDVTLKRRKNAVVIECITDLSDMHDNDPHIDHMMCLELPRHHAYDNNDDDDDDDDDETCTVIVDNFLGIDDVQFVCRRGCEARITIPKLLSEPGEYMLLGPQYRKTGTVSFFWSGGKELNFFEFFRMGDLTNAHGKVRVEKLS